MSLNLESIFRIVGIVMVVIGLAMLPSFFVSLMYGEYEVLITFAFIIALSIAFGLIITNATKKHFNNLKIKDGFIIVSIAWFVAALIGGMPFYFSGSIPSVIDSFFESCSGFSTTGSSILSDIEVLPKGILFWRSFTHWIGGVGILLFAIAAMPSLGISGQNIIVSETPGPMLDKVSPKMYDTARTLLVIYLILTVSEVILLKIGGMSLYDSFIHTFGTVGTGGFSNYNQSIGYFDSTYIRIVITVFMLLCGANFNLFFLSSKKGFSVLLRDIELRYYLLFFAFSSIFIFVMLFETHTDKDAGTALMDSTFQTASILTTTGYVTANYDLWPEACKAILLLLMFIGGCSSSTSGGIKVIRIVILLRLITRGISTRLHPHVIRSAKVSGKTIPNDTVSAIASHMFLYIFLLFLGTFLVSFENIDMTTSFTSVITCLGNIGPGFAAVGAVENFSFMTDFSKLVLSMAMIAGRLELYTLFIVITPQFLDAKK